MIKLKVTKRFRLRPWGEVGPGTQHETIEVDKERADYLLSGNGFEVVKEEPPIKSKSKSLRVENEPVAEEVSDDSRE